MCTGVLVCAFFLWVGWGDINIEPNKIDDNLLRVNKCHITNPHSIWTSFYLFIYLSQLPHQIPWHSIIKLARTSQLSVPHAWNPITGQQFMLYEDTLLFQYWDVKLHTWPLMHSGNHSLLLRLPATNLSEDLVTGERKSDSSIFSLSFSLTLFWTMTSFS